VAAGWRLQRVHAESLAGRGNPGTVGERHCTPTTTGYARVHARRGLGRHSVCVYVCDHLPLCALQISQRRVVPWSYIENVCTHSYSLVWYDWDAWQRYIDWAALSGVNLMLGMTGQEEVQYKVFSKFGLTDMQIRTWFNGCVGSACASPGARCSSGWCFPWAMLASGCLRADVRVRLWVSVRPDPRS
jgi:hypothetical protein